MGALERSLKTIVDWAKSEQRIIRVYFFGSRYKGTAKPESDLDIAVEIVKGENDTSHRATFAFEKEEFLEQLEGRIPFDLDLQLYVGDAETPNMHGFLHEASRVIYESQI